MNSNNIKTKFLWGISMIGLLAIEYWLCRFVFFEMHTMKSWPNTLAMTGLIIIVIATIFEKRITTVATLVGYISGFVLSMIFNADGVDPGGGRINNSWIIWGVVFIASILIGIVLEFTAKRRYENANR